MKTLNKSAERGFVRKTAMPCQAGVFATGSMKTFMKNLAFLLLLKFLKKNSHKVVTWIIMSGIPRKKVVQYRKSFLIEIEEYLKRMPIYVGDTMEIQILPHLDQAADNGRSCRVLFSE